MTFSISTFSPIVHRLAVVAMLAAVLGLTACDSTEPVDDGAGEAEVISDVTLTLTNAADAADVVAASAAFDADGQRLDDASALTLSLTPGATYEGVIAFANRFASDPDEQDVTAEVRAEAREHQVFYALAGDLAPSLTVAYADVETDYTADAEDPSMLRDTVPVGLRFTLTVAADAASGTTGRLRVVLGHYDDGKAPDESLTASVEADVDTVFDVVVR